MSRCGDECPEGLETQPEYVMAGGVLLEESERKSEINYHGINRLLGDLPSPLYVSL